MYIPTIRLLLHYNFNPIRVLPTTTRRLVIHEPPTDPEFAIPPSPSPFLLFHGCFTTSHGVKNGLEICAPFEFL